MCGSSSRRSEAGQKAAASHTGALAGSESALNAAFEKAGVIRADTAEQLFDWARALSSCPQPAGRNAAILTSAGGPGVIASDALAAEGLKLAALSPLSEALLVGLLPPELQNFVVYGVAIPAYNDKPEAAVAFVKFLSAPNKKDFWKASGFELVSATN